MKSFQSGQLRIAVLENGLLSSYTAREALMKRLVSLGHEVYILTHTNENVQKVKDMGLHVIHVGSAKYNPLEILKYITHLRNRLRSIKPDVCLTFTVRPAIWGNLVAQMLNIPVITNITGTGPLLSSHSFIYKIIRIIYPFALRKTKTVFFQNEDDQRQFISRGFVDSSKCQLIPGSGIDVNKFRPVPVHKNEADPFTFLFIGRLLKDKGVLEFIAAARIIKAANPAVKFRIVGPIWKQNVKSNTISSEQLNGWIEEGLIDYTGEKQDVRIELSQADCLVLPSHREGMSNVLLEAASMEKPCIATDVPGCREIIAHEKTGYLCKLQDPEDLALQMEKMLTLNLQERETMGKEGRKKVMREFDKEIVINHYLDEIASATNSEKNSVSLLTRRDTVTNTRELTNSN